MRIGIVASALLALGCASNSEPESHAPAAAHAASHWSYSDQTHWAATCVTGHAQSPIALPTLGNENMPDLVPHYAGGQGRVFNNGHTLQFAAAEGSTVSVGAETFPLLQFHAHAPSEHTLQGQHYPAEIHFVHRNAAGTLAVVGVFVRGGHENAALARVLAAAPAEHGEDHAASLEFDPTQLLPAGHAYFAYSGSLTTPPCSEGVRWHVLAEPIEASAAQIEALRTAIGVSARDVQQLYDRQVHFGG